MDVFSKRIDCQRKIIDTVRKLSGFIPYSLINPQQPLYYVKEDKLILACMEDYEFSHWEIIKMLEELEKDKIIIRRDECLWTPEAYEAEQLLKKSEENDAKADLIRKDPEEAGYKIEE